MNIIHCSKEGALMFRKLSSRLSTNYFVRTSLPCILFLLLISLGSKTIFCQTPTPQKSPEIIALELNKPIENELSGTLRPRYKITLSAHQYVKIRLEQRGIDVGARLYGPDMSQIADYDTESRLTGAEIIEFVPKIDGTYYIDVISKYPFLSPGRYEIGLVDAHPASEKEEIQQDARSAFAESIRLFNTGKYGESRSAIERSIEIGKKEFGSENRETAIALNQLARVIDASGDYDEAIKTNLQALSIWEKLAPNDPNTAISLNGLAINYNHKEDYQKAIDYHRRALEIREKVFIPIHPIIAASLLNMGVVYDKLGDKLKALELYQRALVIQEKTVPENFNTAAVLNNIAQIYNDLEDYQKAEPYALRSVDILEKIYKPDNPRIFEALTTLAVCYDGMRRLDKAEELFQRILTAHEKSVGPDHPLTAVDAFNMGSIKFRRNELEKSESFFRRALQIRETKVGAESPPVSEALSALALLLAKKGDIDQSLKLQQRSDTIDAKNINLNLALGSERQKLAYMNSLSDRLNQSIFIQTKFAPDNPLAIELAVTEILRHKGRVLDAVSNNLIELRRRSNPQDQILLDKLNQLTQQIAELILDGPDKETITEHQLKIKTLTDEREKLEDDISRRAAGFFQKSDPVTLQAIQTLIPRDSALVEFAVYTPDSPLLDNPEAAKQRYVVYVLQNQGAVKWKDLGDTEQINKAVDDLRQALRDPKRKDAQVLARIADEKIMQPVRALLGNSKQLFVSPDGNLNLIPFEALVDEQGHYLIENYAFTYLSSGRDLLRMQTVRESRSKPLIIANPSFGNPSTEQLTKSISLKTAARKRQSITATRNLSDTYFAPLSGTAQEARLIQEIFPDSEILAEGRATETALKQLAAPKILHIATHGFFLENGELARPDNLQTALRSNKAIVKIENPLLRSGLALAGANQHTNAGDDGILTALEASGLNLWGTKLVVLSACDTGLGKIENGEGVYGLRRAFVLAGTESLVMSLWSISDLVTRELMTEYYKNLKQGLGRNAALRRVQLEMLKNPGRRHPFYWAAFIQSGDGSSLDYNR